MEVIRLPGSSHNRGKRRRAKQRAKAWEIKSMPVSPATITKFIYVGDETSCITIEKTPQDSTPKKFENYIRIPETWTKDFIASKQFLDDYLWKVIRMAAFKTHGNKCQCCGARLLTLC